MSAEPLLSAESVRVDVGGVPAIDGLSLATGGDRVLVLGAPRALFEAATGTRAWVRGSVQACGVSPLQAVRSLRLAGAPRDPPMPPAWSVRQYVAWSARLAGHDRKVAGAMTREALDRLQLAPLADTKLARALPTVRRATVVAAAIVTGAAAIALEDPADGIADESARPLARVVARALSDRRMLLFAARIALDSPLALASDEAVCIDGSHVTDQGAPAEIASRERAFSMRVHGDTAAVAAAVTAGGARVLATSAAVVSVDLGPLTTTDLLRIASEARAVVLELRPISRAFA